MNGNLLWYSCDGCQHILRQLSPQTVWRLRWSSAQPFGRHSPRYAAPASHCQSLQSDNSTTQLTRVLTGLCGEGGSPLVDIAGPIAWHQVVGYSHLLLPHKSARVLSVAVAKTVAFLYICNEARPFLLWHCVHWHPRKIQPAALKEVKSTKCIFCIYSEPSKFNLGCGIISGFNVASCSKFWTFCLSYPTGFCAVCPSGVTIAS